MPECNLQLLTIKEVAQRLAVSVDTIRRLAEARKFPQPVRVGRSVRWRMADVEAYLDRGL